MGALDHSDVNQNADLNGACSNHAKDVPRDENGKRIPPPRTSQTSYDPRMERVFAGPFNEKVKVAPPDPRMMQQSPVATTMVYAGPEAMNANNYNRTSADVRPKACPSCGTQNPENAKFCINCAASFNA